VRVLLVGGKGGDERRYVLLAQAMGHELTHCEKSMERGQRAARPDAVLVCMSMCSHPLRKAAQAAAKASGARYVPFVGANVEALRVVLASLRRCKGCPRPARPGSEFCSPACNVEPARVVLPARAR